MSQLSVNDIFNRVFDERSVRIVLVETRDENGDVENVPWFCGRDVCEILGYIDYRTAIHDHIEDDCKQSLGKLVVGVANLPIMTRKQRTLTKKD
jgi:prophage antirepressor-like protein